MSQNIAPILIIAASTQSSEHQSTDSITQASKQNHSTSQKNGYSNKLNLNRVRKPKQNDKSEPGRRNEVVNPYNNVSRLSLEKKLQDESGLDVISNTSRSIFSTESPRDTKTIQSLKQKSYYLGSLKPSEPKEESRTSKNNPNSSYAGGSVYPSITLDESNTNIHRNEGSLLLENKSKNVSKAQSLNFIQSKRVSSIGTKLYHGFKKSSTIQNISEQVESFEMPRIVSLQQNDLKPQVSEKIDSEKQSEEPVHVPRPPSKGALNKTRSLGSHVLDHRRPKKAVTEAYSTIVKTKINLDTQAYNSVPTGTAPQSMTNLPSQDSTLDNERCETEPDSVSQSKVVRTNAERRGLNRTSLNSKASKENDVSSQTDLSNGQNFNYNVKIPLKPVSSNISNVERPVKRVLNSKASNSELRGSSKEDLMRRFNEIVSYQTQPVQSGNPQILQEKNKNQGRPITSMKDKENSMRRSVKQKQDENKPAGSGVQKGVKPEDASTNSIDAKIMLLKNKIKDKEYKRKTRKNQCLEEGEGEVNPLKTKLAEHLDNRGEMEEEMKKRLLVMRKIQLYDILIKQKMGKKLPKEALRLVKAEFDKVNMELEELKLHEQ